MKFASINKCDSGNGPGVRVSFWVQGCPIHCTNCHNKSIWNFEDGQDYTPDVQETILDLCDLNYISGLSILGGEPLSGCNLASLATLTQAFKTRYPKKTIWVWTGYVLEDLLEKYKENIWFNQILTNIDVLIDGPYDETKRNVTDANQYRGSENQRIIDVQKTLKIKKVTEL